VVLIEKYPFLEKSAFIVIGILGIKLCLSILVKFVPSAKWIEGEHFDLIISALTLAIFILPILWIQFRKK
jgi:ABC-type phosphate transport system permease subunit